MAGHFLLQGISQQEFQYLSKQNLLSATQHLNIGWNQNSKKALQKAINGVPSNRNGLPPHKYILLNAGTNISSIDVNFNNLSRPQGFFLRNLCQTANTSWNAGNHLQALQDQVNHGSVSIEVYYISGLEMH